MIKIKKYCMCFIGCVTMIIMLLAMFDQKRLRSYMTPIHSGNDICKEVESKTQGSECRTWNSSFYRQMHELHNITRSSNSFRQRRHELQRLGDLVQRRLHYLQNPRNCNTAKKILCKFRRVGFGSQMRDWISCLIIAYATKRTLVIESRGWPYAEGGLDTIFLPISTNCTSINNQTVIGKGDLSDIENIPVVQLPSTFRLVKIPRYLPFSIPEDIADEIKRVHNNPEVWWIGQFLVYLTRQNHILEHFVGQSISSVGSFHPIVGIHVRRTDKRGVAKYHDLDEYMSHVETWFNKYDTGYNVVKRRVYLASDETDVLIQARERYPNYTFVSNVNASAVAKNGSTRYSVSSLEGLILDVQVLSMCDFFVCTLSSNVGRMVYEMMNVRYFDASDRIRSLDTEYSFTGHFTRKFIVKYGIKSLPKWINIVKDVSKNPKRTMFSLDNPKSRVIMPTYPNVQRWL